MLAKLMFISLVLFTVWQFHFVSGNFQTAYAKIMYSSPTISCVNHMKCQSVVCPKRAFMPCWIAVVRVLHFSVSLFENSNSYCYCMVHMDTFLLLLCVMQSLLEKKINRFCNWKKLFVLCFCFFFANKISRKLSKIATPKV